MAVTRTLWDLIVRNKRGHWILWTTYRSLSTLMYPRLTEASKNIEQRWGTFFATQITQPWQARQWRALCYQETATLPLKKIFASAKYYSCPHQNSHILPHIQRPDSFSSQRDCTWYWDLWFSQGKPWQYPHFHIYIIDILCIPLAPFIRGLISFTDSNELMLAMPM